MGRQVMMMSDEYEGLVPGNDENNHLTELNKSNTNFSELDFCFSTSEQEQNPLSNWTYLTNVINCFGSIYSSLQLNKVLEFVIDSLISVIQADRGFLLLKNSAGRLEFKIARDANKCNLPRNSFRIIKDILINSYKTKAIYFYDDIRNEEQLNRHKIIQRSIICCPILLDNEIMGLIYADSKEPIIGDSEIKKGLVQLFSNQAAIAIRNAMYYQMKEQSLQSLSNSADTIIDVEKNAVQSELAARIGHTLNSILQDTASNLELATKYLEDTNNREKVIERLKSISCMLKDLQGLSTDLIEHINIESNLKVYDLNVLVKEFIQFAITVYSQAGVQFSSTLGTPLPMVKIDKTQMHLVLYNIVNYILGKTPDRQFQFNTDFNNDQQRVKLSISNKSLSLSKEEFYHLFQPLSNNDEDIENRFGLLISKEIILKHNGSLSVENSKDEIRFLISIPILQ